MRLIVGIFRGTVLPVFRLFISLLISLTVGCQVENLLDTGTTPRRDTGVDLDAGIPLDSGHVDAGQQPDAQETDSATETDSGTEDAGSLDALPPDATCDLSDMGDPNKDRVVLVGQPFTATPGVDGTEIRSLSLSSAGTLTDNGMRLDVGVRPARILFTKNGEYALVLGESGTLVSVAMNGTTISVVDQVTLPSAGYGDLQLHADGTTLFVVGSNVAETSGISTVRIGCDGSLTEDEAAFFNIRLSASLALLPDGLRGVLLGGQAVFDPVDDNDVRLISFSGTGWTEIAPFDIYTDFIDALRIAVSPDGSTLLIPNGSPFSTEGGQLSISSISGNTITEVSRLTGLSSAREAMFSYDGDTALVSRLEENRIAILSDPGTGFEVTGEITGIGLAEQMAQIERGNLAGHVLVPSVDPSGGPNIAQLEIQGPGVVADLGQVELGSGSTNIPTGIAVTP